MTLASGRDLALIYFILIGFAIGLIPLAVLALTIKGLRLGTRRMMPYVHLAQFYAARVARVTYRGSERITMPFIAAAGAAQRIRTFTTQLAERLGLQ